MNTMILERKGKALNSLQTEVNQSDFRKRVQVVSRSSPQSSSASGRQGTHRRKGFDMKSNSSSSIRHASSDDSKQSILERPGSIKYPDVHPRDCFRFADLDNDGESLAEPLPCIISSILFVCLHSSRSFTDIPSLIL